MGFFDKIRQGLKKTKENLGSALSNIFSGGRKVDDETLDELEEALILADMGVSLTSEVMDELRARINRIAFPCWLISLAPRCALFFSPEDVSQWLAQ